MAAHLTYRPLDPSRQEIRLITLLPPDSGPSSARSTLVNCTLTHVSLEDNPRYYALSYVWGDPELTSPICVDGKIFLATLNLEAALRHLRKPDEPITFWIDAICIDQENDVEKSDQVQRMGDIYRGAYEVTIWLGQAKPESSMLWNQLKQLGDYASQSPIELNFDHLVDVDEKETRASWHLQLNMELRKTFEAIHIGFDEGDTLLIEPLCHLLTRPWWSRIWVVQESALAPIARVVWGSNEMYWGILWAALGHLASWLQFQAVHLMGDESYHRAFFMLERSQPYWVPLVGAWERKNRAQDEDKTKLIQMLLQTSVCSSSTATDPRDCIYGLMGLIDDAEELGIKVDYSRSFEAIYEEVAQVLIKTEGLKMLQCCQFSPKHQSGSLHSWIPDWSSPLRLLLDGLRILLPSGVYNASGVMSSRDARRLQEAIQRSRSLFGQDASQSDPSNSTETYYAFDASKPGVLSVAGVKVDKIASVGYPWEEAGDVLDCYYRDVLWVQELERLAEMSNGPYSKEAKQEALWRTPICDRGLPRLTYIWFPRATTESLGHSVLTGKFPMDDIKEESRSIFFEKSRVYQKILRAFGKGRRMFVTEAGFLGMGPDSCEVGDSVFIIKGASTPFVLRDANENQYKIIGEAYVHGIMDGEFMRRNPTVSMIDIV